MDIAVARILDANFNRAREAMRVMEDHVRFVLNDATLAGSFKTLRHDLRDVLDAWNIGGAMIARDTPGDVGTGLRTESEYRRATKAEVVAAAGKRLSEALRVLEEYGKTFDSHNAARVESLRYRGYALERDLLHILAVRDRFAGIRLYVLVTEALCRRPWREVVEGAARGGAGCLQLREKNFEGRRFFERAMEFRSICRDFGVLCIINDRADIAAAVGADGVHLGQDDLPVPAARRAMGTDAIVGVSTHSTAQATEAAADGPDYIAVGPMFPTKLKPEYGVAGRATLAEIRTITPLPLIAIGGITPENAGAVFAAGANAVAVCTAVIGAEDPAEAARRLVGA